MKDARWTSDLMQRHKAGDFLKRFILQKHESGKYTGSISCAVDGAWGSGKTFFVDNWGRDLENQNHAVIRFDAWKNDLSDDPLVGFIAEIKKNLACYAKEVPEARRKTIEAHISSFVKKAGKAMVPTAIAAAKGVTAKFLGQETVEVLTGAGQDDANDPQAVKEASEKAVEVFFENALDAHTKKMAAIESLTSELNIIVRSLEEEKVLNLPIFICVDELDRCRPTYAITLLEGAKHLLNSMGVCFVFSTNITQLTESIKAVYGSGFDAHMYLKRFFDFQFHLPEPNNAAFGKHLLSQSTIATTRICSGVPGFLDGHLHGFGEPETATAILSDHFQIDLRSQQQIFTIVEAVAASVPKDHTIHLSYLFSLAALSHKNPSDFKRIAIKKEKTFTQYAKEAGLFTPGFSFAYHNLFGHKQAGHISISDILDYYHTIPQLSAAELKTATEEGDFRAKVATCFIENPSIGISIASYPYLVKQAGLISR